MTTFKPGDVVRVVQRGGPIYLRRGTVRSAVDQASMAVGLETPTGEELFWLGAHHLELCEDPREQELERQIAAIARRAAEQINNAKEAYAVHCASSRHNAGVEAELAHAMPRAFERHLSRKVDLIRRGVGKLRLFPASTALARGR